jgi:hypothetical protein
MSNQMHTRLTCWAAILLFAVQLEAICRAQTFEAQKDAVAPETQAPPEILPRYNIPWGSGGLNFSAGLRALYVDNVYLTQTGARDDFILVPECDIGAFFPIGQSNTVVLDLGLAYYQYLKNTALNTGTPVVNPNSELAFNIRSGNLTFGFSESFSYQVTPIYDTGTEFYNLYNTAQFRRYQNRVGTTVTWDLHDLVVSAGYHHENLWSDGSFYDAFDHASELFNADAMLTLSPVLTAGLEAVGSLNNFDNTPTYDTWRARLGPAVRLNVSQFIKARAGAGYERIEYDSASASSLGLSAENTYYAYAAVDHQINQFFSHSLAASHDNQLGFNAANLEGTHVSYSLSWKPNERLTLTPHVSVNWYDESYGSGSASLYHEKFTYVAAGLTVRRQFGQHWRAGLIWDYRLKDSDIQADGYAQNQAALELIYQF